MNAILSGLTETVFVKVMHYEIAKEIWDKLKKGYARPVANHRR